MKTRLFFIVIFFFYTATHFRSAGQDIEDDSKHLDVIGVCIGFYNVENLFDTINDPRILDEEFTPEGLNRWTSERYWEKLDNLGRVIAAMGTDFNADGPAVLGVSEVENTAVLNDLVRQEQIIHRNYHVVHYEGPDARGVDVAFLYQPKYFTYISSKAFPAVVEGRPDFRTRDQLLLTGELLGERMHFIVSHWPSRRGGERRSRPLRIAMAKNARQIIDSIQDAEPGARIIFMGDLNDNPTDVSLRKYLRSKGNRTGLRADEMYNPFENLFKRGVGSNAWRDSWSLFDQILVNPGFFQQGFSTWTFYKAEVFNAPFLRQASGRFQGYPLRTFGSGVYLGGYSDHFPTLIYLIREK